MGPFMVEIVFCRVTRRGRKLKAGMNKAGKENCRNDGPMQSFIPPDDTIKITLDLSDNGPVFSAMDQMMMQMMEDEEKDRKGKKGGGKEAKDSLKRLMKSGIPGVEKLFSGPGQAPAGPGKKGGKGFHKMNDASKQKFMTAIFGEDGTSIETGTAAALLAATCSGGDPEIGNNIAQLLVPEMGDKVDPAMMAALMGACSLINAGASTEEVMKSMMAELANAGLTQEDILHKTQVLMKAFKREDPTATLAEYALASKQKNLALKQNNTSPKDFTLAVLVMKAFAACGTTPENVSKIIMIENQLSKKGAQSRFISTALMHLANFEGKRASTVESIKKAFEDDKITRDDVFLNVRMAQGIENENEPTWKEVKNMKDTLSGCSPTSPEGIELNLAKATKTAGLKNTDIAAVLVAQKVMAALEVDPKTLAQVVNIMKTIADNGVPAVEIARVLSDGLMPKEMIDLVAEKVFAALEKDIQPADVDLHVKVYDNLKLKANIPQDVIEYIDNKLIQVRCSLEDVADNLVCAQLARGEKEGQVIRSLCSTLQNTGSSPEIVATTMMASLRRVLEKQECDIMKDIGRTMHEQGTEKDSLQKAMTEMLLNLLDEDLDNWDLRQDAMKALEQVLKEAGGFPNEIRDFINGLDLPPEPPDPKDPEVIAAMEAKRLEEEAAAEAERLRLEQEEADRLAAEAAAAAEAEAKASKKGRKKAQVNGHPNPAVDGLISDSRRGSYDGSRRGSSGSVILGGTSRRGSYYSDDVSKKATVAMVVDSEVEPKSVFDMDGSEENGTTTEIITVTDPATGKPVQQIVQTKIDPKTGKKVKKKSKVPANTQVQTVIDPNTGQLVQALVDPATGEQVTLSPNANAAGNVSGAAAVQVITVADPVTGEPVQQMVQSVVDPSTGQTIQVPVQSNAAGGGGGGNTQIVMVNNPVTGEQMQQVVQTVVDPTTGKTVQIPVDSSSNNGAQIVTVTDPQTGQPVQQIVQTVIDPATGKPTQVMTPLSNTQNVNGASSVGGNQSQQIIMIPDPITGEPVQHLIQTVTDPLTGKSTQKITNLSTNTTSEGQIITVTDPKTGESIQQIIQTVIDPKTGKPKQIKTPINAGQILQPQLSNMIQGNSIMGAGQQQQIVNVTDPNTGKIVQKVVQMPCQQQQQQIINVTDPNTGKIVQKVVQNTIDPKTGKTVQVTMPIAGQQQQQQIINVTDPDTGQLVQKVVQNTVDPKTGKIVQVATPINSISNTDGVNNAGGGLGVHEIVIAPDPVTGELKQQIIQTVLDPITGQPNQVMIPFDGGLPTNDDSILDLYNGRAPVDVLEGILSSALEEGDIGADLEETLRTIRSGKVTDEEVNKLMTVFHTSGVVSSAGGVTRLRKISDLRKTLEATNDAFDAAMEMAANREGPQISEENRKLMQDILNRSQSENEDMSSRVRVLLAGSALTTKAGVRIERRDTIEQVDYTAVGDDLSKLKERFNVRRKAKSEVYSVPLHQASSEVLDIRAADAGLRVQRKSIKRISLARLRKTSEFSGLRHPPGGVINPSLQDFDADNLETYRKIVGLKSSKVPMMVYSHGGFSRCFRIARRYQVDGPPIGVRYDDKDGGMNGTLTEEPLQDA